MRWAIAWACVAATLGGAPALSKEKLARNMKAAPIGNPADWFTTDDYPPDAVRSARQGRVVVAVGVDSVGKVVSCDIEISSSTASLDRQTCDLAMQRGTFNPATDRKGLPVASVYHLPVRWVLPDDDQATQTLTAADVAKMDIDMTVELTVGPDGMATSCRVVAAKMPEGEKRDPCKQVPAGTPITPGWKRGDRPVGAKVVRHWSQSVTLDP